MLLIVLAAEFMAVQYYRRSVIKLGEPWLSVGRTNVDLGPIVAEPAGIRKDFHIYNQGGSNLKLKPGSVSNGLKVSVDRSVVRPGEWASVWLGLDTPPEAIGSHLQRSFSIYSNDPRRPEVKFTIEADVLPTFAETESR